MDDECDVPDRRQRFFAIIIALQFRDKLDRCSERMRERVIVDDVCVYFFL